MRINGITLLEKTYKSAVSELSYLEYCGLSFKKILDSRNIWHTCGSGIPDLRDFL